MKKNIITLIGVIVFALASTTAIAHHSAAPFDFTQQVNLKGVVKKFTVVNPHSYIKLEVTDEDRGTRDIVFEGMSASTFYRAGYTRNSVKVGDVIQVTFAPRYNKDDGGFIMSFVTSGGKDIGFTGGQ